MNPVHIFRTYSFKNRKTQLERVLILAISALHAKKIYGEISVITDDFGEHLIKKINVPYDNIIVGLETGQEQIGEKDAIVIAFKKLARVLPDFLYLDYNRLYNHKIPDSGFVAYAESTYQYNTKLKLLTKRGVDFYFKIFPDKPIFFLDFSIFKCSNKNIIDEFFESYFSSLYQNENLLAKKSEAHFFSGFIAQHYLYEIFKKNDVLNITYLHNKKSKSKLNFNSSNRLDLFIEGESSDKYNIINFGVLNYPNQFSKWIYDSKYI